MKGLAPEILRNLPSLAFAGHFCSAVNSGIIKDAVFVKTKKQNETATKKTFQCPTPQLTQQGPSCRLHWDRVAKATPLKNTF